MAKQHFYSRVPARMAMYFKANGFDTFASSEGVKQDFIEKDLACVLEQKPTQDELSLIRKNELAPIYVHYATKDGVFVESCVSFLESDYTGERSSYLVHSLIFDEDDEVELHYHNHSLAIDESLFVHNLDSFDVNNLSSKWTRTYPELPIERKVFDEPITWLAESYNHITLMTFIHATIGAVFGKYKCVHVVLPNNKNSEQALKFFNSFIQLVPFNFRKNFSFVSRCSDFNKYPGFKIKVIEETMGNAPASKGVTINFITNETFGIKEKDLGLYGVLPDFFYRLITEKEERYALYRFCDYVIKHFEDADLHDAKLLMDIVFLFRASCGMYEERIVLPDDNAVFELIQVYEKYRNSMEDEERIAIVNCLKRYPDTYVAIPKNTFNKITKFYPTEILGTKHVIMGVCLELIHTDLMRTPLFNFIQNNFDNEDEESKETIIKHLAAVFNGEFLQEQILEFFKNRFENLSIESRSIIFENLCLAIRTPAIQDSLFNFFNEKYTIFTLEEKIVLYNLCAEHLPEGDDLCIKLIGLCDSYIYQEPEKLVSEYTKALSKLLLTEQKNKAELLLPVVCKSDGFTFETISKQVFTKWQKKKLSTHFIIYSLTGTFTERINKIIKMWQISKDDIEGEIQKKFIKACVEAFNEYPCIAEMDEIFSASEILHKELDGKDEPNVKEFITKFDNLIIDKIIGDSLENTFRSKQRNSVEKILKYCEKKEEISTKPAILSLKKYVEIKNAILNENIDDVIKLSKELFEMGDIAKRASQYLVIDVYEDFKENLDLNLISMKTTLCFYSMFYLKSGKVKLNDIYDKLVDFVNDKYEDPQKMAYTIQGLVCSISKNVLTIANNIFNNFGSIEKLKEDALSFDSGIQLTMSDVFVKYGKSQVSTIISSIKSFNTELENAINAANKGVKSNAGLFAKVYKL